MRIGIFGGSFDPIHNGHLFVAQAAREERGLDRVVFVPTHAGKHYRNGNMSATPEARGAMVRLAIAANTAFGFDESDLQPDSTGYTADLVPKLAAHYPGDELTFIVGADSLVRSRWNRLEEVLDVLTAFVVAPRNDITPAQIDAAIGVLPEALRAKIALLDSPLVEESATLIRERLQAGKSVRYLVPEPVYRYIDEWKLYR
ncbi:MAG: nicotinate-nucleotide adenylyltransferase [Candidatus Velthaea sp.]